MSPQLTKLLVALGLDNFGTGIFSPLLMLYLVQDQQLEIGTAGAILSATALLAIAVPPIAAHWMDTVGGRKALVFGQGMQAVGMLLVLLPFGVFTIVLGAVLCAVGLQLFFCALGPVFADHQYRSIDYTMSILATVRGGAFGAGAVIGSFLASLLGSGGYRFLGYGNALSFVVAAVLVSTLPKIIRKRCSSDEEESVLEKSSPPKTNRRVFYGLLLIAFSITLPLDYFLIGTSVVVVEGLGLPAYIVGMSVAIVPASTVLLSTWVSRNLERIPRLSCLAISLSFIGLWAFIQAILGANPSKMVYPLVLASAGLIAASNLVSQGRLTGLVLDVVAEPERGRYFSIFQLAYSVAAVVAPSLVALYYSNPFLPSCLVGTLVLIGGLTVLSISKRLPVEARFSNSSEVN